MFISPLLFHGQSATVLQSDPTTARNQSKRPDLPLLPTPCILGAVFLPPTSAMRPCGQIPLKKQIKEKRRDKLAKLFPPTTVAAAILVFVGAQLLIQFNPDSQLLEIWENVIFPRSALHPGGPTFSPTSLIGRWERNGKNCGGQRVHFCRRFLRGCKKGENMNLLKKKESLARRLGGTFPSHYSGGGHFGVYGRAASNPVLIWIRSSWKSKKMSFAPDCPGGPTFSRSSLTGRWERNGKKWRDDKGCTSADDFYVTGKKART
ncbi:hypothetical protein CDAR_570101 [Caerostris darwini]|uniref:Uncharacterized protein n=1 Tax=Caerostris darwini TaxID=1538125 RepID=A0AAV4S003_9ARAC|nr:hypothetical protein CDAR_570101 [Caerostris darwini]